MRYPFFSCWLSFWRCVSLWTLAAWACSPAIPPRTGDADHDWMVDTLARLARQAEPEKVYSLNRQRAELAEKHIARARSREDKVNASIQAAEEWLNAGETQKAIDQLESLLGKPAPAVVIQSFNRKAVERLALAYLRLGEQQNCQLSHSPESCVLPLQGNGLHTLKSGSETAFDLYSRLLADDPSDLRSRYLLNLAAMTLGVWPQRVPESFRLPASYLGSENPSFPEFSEVAMQNGAALNGLSGGVVVADFNGDGKLDLMASSHGLTDPLRLLLADAEGGFRESAHSGLAGITGGLNLIQADYDNDGDTDVLVLRGGWLKDGGLLPNSLLQNQGDGTFRDVTRSSGLLSFLPTQTGAWADLNRDGWLDLVIGNEGAPIEVFISNRDGTFSEQADLLGISGVTYVKGVTIADYDLDGWPDIFCAVLGHENLLYHNETETSGSLRFAEKAAQAGVQLPRYAFPAWFWDYNQDGWPDLYVGAYDLNDLDQIGGEVYAEAMGYTLFSERPRLYRNRGDGGFEEVTSEAGLGKLSWAMGSSYGDLNNDGFPDLLLATGAPDYSALLPNQLWLNARGRQFIEVTRPGRFGHLQKGHGVAFADFDHDGSLDVYVVLGGAYEGDLYPNALYRNPGFDGSWISLELEGVTANRSALGARIRLVTVGPDGKIQTHYHAVSPGGSFGGNSLRAHIGLGSAVSVRLLEVVWPSPQPLVSRFEGIALNARYFLKEGDTLRPRTQPGIIWRERPAGHKHTH